MYFEVSDQFTQSNSPFSAHPRFWSRNARVYQQKRALVAKSVWFRLSLTSPRCGSTFGHHLKTSDRIEHSNVLRWWDSVWKSNLINQFWCLAFEIGFTTHAFGADWLVREPPDMTFRSPTQQFGSDPSVREPRDEMDARRQSFGAAKRN